MVSSSSRPSILAPRSPLGNWFFADLSHKWPVHPSTLAFLCEQAGFTEIRHIARSRHDAMEGAELLDDDLQGTATRRLLESVFGYQDYALFARRP